MKTGRTSAEICWPLRAGIRRLTFFSCISLFITISHWGSWNRFVWIRWWWDGNLRLKRWFSCIFGKRWPFYLGWMLMIRRSCLLFKRKDLDTVEIHIILLFSSIKNRNNFFFFYKSTGWWQVVKFRHESRTKNIHTYTYSLYHRKPFAQQNRAPSSLWQLQ